jgi:hypothetical protein
MEIPKPPTESVNVDPFPELKFQLFDKSVSVPDKTLNELEEDTWYNIALVWNNDTRLLSAYLIRDDLQMSSEILLIQTILLV